jgi:hypothetical protein
LAQANSWTSVTTSFPPEAFIAVSYDFHLFRPKPGVDLLLTAEQDLESEYPGRHDPEKEARNRVVAAALVRVNPALQVSEASPEYLAELRGVSREEAEGYFRDIEIDAGEHGNGIQISLFADEADVSVPYWHTGQTAEAVFAEIWQYIQVIEQETGFKTYDSQTGRIVESWSDMEAALSSNVSTVPRIRELPG